jgi:SAM-dependent methyltransferase
MIDPDAFNAFEAAGWEQRADGYDDFFGPITTQLIEPLLDAAQVGAGSRVLDVASGPGYVAADATERGASVVGIDVAAAMVSLARRLHPELDFRHGDAEALAFPDASFDAVVAVNALQFALDVLDALAEAARVLVPGGAVGVAGWAEGPRNDLDVVERAVAAAQDDEVLPDGDLRQPGGLEAVLAEAGLELVTAGLVATPWTVADDDALVRGVLLGEDATTMAELAPVVVAAAEPFRTAGGGYRLVNAFRFAVATTPAG